MPSHNFEANHSNQDLQTIWLQNVWLHSHFSVKTNVNSVMNS